MGKQQFLEFLSRMDTMKEVIKINNPEKYHELIKQDRYWTPETRVAKYSEWVMQNYEFDVDDPLSLCIYSLLMNKSIKELKESIIHDFGHSIRK